MNGPQSCILELSRVCKAFAKPSGEPLAVLSGVDLALREGEILGLLGRSGSGKSTLLRIAGGLIKPTGGEVLYRGKPLAGLSEGIAVVFQTFALFPKAIGRRGRGSRASLKTTSPAATRNE